MKAPESTKPQTSDGAPVYTSSLIVYGWLAAVGGGLPLLMWLTGDHVAYGIVGGVLFAAGVVLILLGRRGDAQR